MEIPPNIHRLRFPLPFKLSEVNLYLIEGEGGPVLVDTGIASGSGWETLCGLLTEVGVKPEEIRTAFITHLHADHSGLAGRLKEASSATLMMGKLEADLLDEWFERPELLEQVADLAMVHGLPRIEIELIRTAIFSLGDSIIRFRADRRLEGGDRLRLAGVDFEVIHTPGHSPGHLCLYAGTERLLLSGDHILPTITPNVSYEPGFASGDPLGDYLSSLRKICELDVVLTLPAHGEPFDNLPERVDEILRHHDERIGIILRALEDGRQTAYELRQAVFGEDLDPFECWMAFGEILAHLFHMVQQGLLEEVRQKGLILYRSTGKGS